MLDLTENEIAVMQNSVDLNYDAHGLWVGHCGYISYTGKW